MTKQRATLKQYSQSNNKNQGFFRSRYMYGALVGTAFLSALLVSACSPQTHSDSRSSVTDKNTISRNNIEKNSKNIEDGIKNSYARLASKRSDVCPKLIEEEHGSQVIERLEEVMVNDYCDYFLYPRDGQSISVATNNRQIEALLIVPSVHNFANGGYQVTSYDKHIIRLSYNGATHKPKDLSYDVAMTISDKAYL